MSLFGGMGRVIGSVFGSLLIRMINNGPILAGLDASQQRMIPRPDHPYPVALAPKK